MAIAGPHCSMRFQVVITVLVLFAYFSASFALKCNGIINSPKVIEEDVDFSNSFCTLRGVTVKGSVIGTHGGVLVTEGPVTILGSVVLVTDGGSILGDELEIHGELNVQGPIGKNPRHGIDKVVVGRATINKVVIRNEAFVTLNYSDVGGVLMDASKGSGARGLRTVNGIVRNGGISMLNQRGGGIINLQGTNVTGPVKISGVKGVKLLCEAGWSTQTELQGGLYVEKSSGDVEAYEARFRGSKLEVKDFNGFVSMGDMAIPNTMIQRLNGTLNWRVAVDSSLKIIDSTGVLKMGTIPPSTGPIELKNSLFTGFVKINGISGDVTVIGNEGFDLSAIGNTGGVLIEGNKFKSLKCSDNVPAPILSGNLVTGDASDQCAAV